MTFCQDLSFIISNAKMYNKCSFYLLFDLLLCLDFFPQRIILLLDILIKEFLFLPEKDQDNPPPPPQNTHPLFSLRYDIKNVSNSLNIDNNQNQNPVLLT